MITSAALALVVAVVTRGDHRRGPSRPPCEPRDARRVHAGPPRRWATGSTASRGSSRQRSRTVREEGRRARHPRVARRDARPRRGADPLCRGGGVAARGRRRGDHRGDRRKRRSSRRSASTRTPSGAAVGPPGGAAVRAVGLSYHYREGGGTRRADALCRRSSDRVGGWPPRIPHRLRPGRGASCRRSRVPDARGDRGPRGAGDREGLARRPSVEAPTADALTGLATRQELHETLALDVARAHRGGLKLAVCVLDVDDLGAANTRLGSPATDDLIGRDCGTPAGDAPARRPGLPVGRR